MTVEDFNLLREKHGYEAPESSFFEDGLAPDGVLPMVWHGGGSGRSYDSLIDCLCHTKGNADLLLVWNQGDTFQGIRVVDGVVTEHTVKHRLASQAGETTDGPGPVERANQWEKHVALILEYQRRLREGSKIRQSREAKTGSIGKRLAISAAYIVSVAANKARQLSALAALEELAKTSADLPDVIRDALTKGVSSGHWTAPDA